MVSELTNVNKERYFGFNPDKVQPEQVIQLWNKERESWKKEKPLTIFLAPIDETVVMGKDLLIDRIRTFPDGSTTPHVSKETARLVDNRNIVLITSMGGNGGAKDKDVRAAARYYKSWGASKVLVVATKLLDSRQDRHFPQEPPTLFSVIKEFSDDLMPNGERTVDAMLLPDNHSSLLFQMAGGLKFPVFGMTGYKFMINRVGLADRVREKGRELFVQLAPDANRHKTAHDSAEFLGIDVVSCKKTRDPETGDLAIENEEEVIGQLERKTNVVMFDDEIATASTTRLLMEVAQKANPNMSAVVLAIHNNCSVNALRNLSHPVIKDILITDTMMPPLSRKNKELLRELPIRIVPVGDSLMRVGEYIMMGEDMDSLPDDWMSDPWFNGQ